MYGQQRHRGANDWVGLPSHGPSPLPLHGSKDTLGVALQDGVVRVVGVLHGDGLRELAEHPLLEGLQPLVVVAPAHVLFVLPQRREHMPCLACPPSAPQSGNPWGRPGAQYSALYAALRETTIKKGEGQQWCGVVWQPSDCPGDQEVTQQVNAGTTRAGRRGHDHLLETSALVLEVRFGYRES